MSGIVFYILDLETSGLVSKNYFHEICELSLIRASDRVQLTRHARVINWQNASFDALRIIGKTVDDLKQGVSREALIGDVEKFLAEDKLTPAHRCLIGHNIISFDKKFLWHLWENHNKFFPFDLYLDTFHMMKAYAKREQLIKPKLNLQAACDIMGINKIAGAHSAKSDTQNNYLLWQELIKKIDYLDFIKRIPHSKEENFIEEH